MSKREVKKREPYLKITDATLKTKLPNKIVRCEEIVIQKLNYDIVMPLWFSISFYLQTSHTGAN